MKNMEKRKIRSSTLKEDDVRIDFIYSFFCDQKAYVQKSKVKTKLGYKDWIINEACRVLRARGKLGISISRQRIHRAVGIDAVRFGKKKYEVKVYWGKIL